MWEGDKGAKQPSRVNRRRKKNTEGSVCRKVRLVSGVLAPHTRLLVAGTTCCPTWQASGTEGLGGSGWTACRQRSSSGPEGGKKNTRPQVCCPTGTQAALPMFGTWGTALPCGSQMLGQKIVFWGPQLWKANSSNFL